MGSSVIKEYEPYTPNQELYHKRREPNLEPGGINYVSPEELGMLRYIPSPLEDIATALRRLTYGEMIQLATEISSHMNLDPNGLASVLHKWSTEHGTPEPATRLVPEEPNRD